MKRLLFFLIMLLTACSSASAGNTLGPPSVEITPQLGNHIAPGPTELFITQVMATKYTLRTQYASLPTITSTPPIPADSPACRPSDLRMTFNTNGATGRIVFEVGVTNTSHSACFLPSWPRVELTNRAGQALQITYDYIYVDADPSNLPPTQQSNPGQPVVFGMTVNQTAGLALMWGNWCSGALQGGVIIRMYLLQTGSWVDIPTDIEGGGYCDDASSPSTLDVVGFGY